MSGFGAIVDLGEPAAAPVSAERMVLWLRRRGRDGLNTWSEGGVALVHAALVTTPAAIAGTQPAVSPCGRYRITAFARIDNRAELRLTLGTGEASDPELILAAYARWGEECVRRLLGDFAFALWDGEARRLFCARDPFGVRSLHYSAGDGRIVVGSEVGVVLAGLDRPPAHNRAFLEDILANRWPRWLHETAYTGIFRLPPAHRLRFSERGVQLERYWQPTVHSTPRKDDREYLEEFRVRFTRAVQDRLVAPGPIGLAVSGGMDSSSVAAVTEALVASGDVCVEGPVWLYSTVFSDTKGADEREYFDAVAAHCRHLQARPLLSDDCWSMKEFGKDGGFPLDEPEVGLNRMHPLCLGRAAAQDGCRVLLSGFAGDQALCGEPYFQPHLLRDVPLASLPQELAHFRRLSRRPGWWILATAFGLPLLPPAWQAALSRQLRRAENAARKLPLRAPSETPLTMPDPLPAPELQTRAAAEIFHQIASGAFQAEMGDVMTLGLQCGVEWRLPFLDQRLVELTMSMPASALFHRGWSKRTVREGLAELLPEKIRTRTGFSHFSELIQRGLREKERARRLELLTRPLIVKQGLVEAARLEAAWSAWENDPQQYCYRPLFASLLIEAWLRSKEEEGGVNLANCSTDEYNQR